MTERDFKTRLQLWFDDFLYTGEKHGKETQDVIISELAWIEDEKIEIDSSKQQRFKGGFSTDTHADTCAMFLSTHFDDCSDECKTLPVEECDCPPFSLVLHELKDESS